MRWLISNDGSSLSREAALFAATLLKPGQDSVVLLGILNKTGKTTLTQALEEIQSLLGDMIEKTILLGGSVPEVIQDVACHEGYDIIVYASRGRRGLTKALLGSVAAKLAAEIPGSLLVVRKGAKPVEKILIPTTLTQGHDAPLILGAELARRVGASVTALHVMSQIALSDSANVEQLQLTAEEAIEQQTREGIGLTRAKELLEAEGVEEVHPLIRHGLVEDEILDEANSGNYDMVVLGAHSAARRSWETYLVEDVTSDVLLNTRCPVLIVRR